MKVKVVGVPLDGHRAADDVINGKVAECQKKQLIGSGANQSRNNSHNGLMPYHSMCCLLFAMLLFSAL